SVTAWSSSFEKNLRSPLDEIFWRLSSSNGMVSSRSISLLFLICLLLQPSLPHTQVNRRLAIDYLNRGTVEMEAGNLDTALAHFERAIELDPNYGAAYFSRGLVKKRSPAFD